MQGYVHLDIKLENLLVDDNYNLILSDFGSANYNINTDHLMPLYETIGTNMYVSPEVYINYYNNKSDIWSTGVCLYMLLTGSKLYKNVAEHISSDDDISLKDYSVEINDLLNQLLNKNPYERISCNEALNHKCFQ